MTPGRRNEAGLILRVVADVPASERFRDVRVFETLDSTNRYVLDEARAGAPEGLVAVADHQTAGRARRDRSWESPPGASLLVSVLLRPRVGVDRMQLLTMASSLAMAEAVEDVAGVRALLKWPNDLVVGPRKLGGVLAEADVSSAGEVRAVAIGTGLNVMWTEFPPDLADVATACNLESGRAVDRFHVLRTYLARLETRYDALDSAASDYRARLDTLGRQVRVERADGPVVGTAVDVGHAGELLVETGPGCIVEVVAGDVVHLRPI
jgi:BirA family transcriptional regulator, biotin operon repressor / biotin---[acetyl-CoA-carboxylase] ligase